MNRKSPLMVAIVIVLAVIVALVRLATQPPRHEERPAPHGPEGPASTGEDALALGNPSGAAEHDRDNWLLIRPTFAASYNNKHGTPNWVSWQLVSADLGNTPRHDAFRADNGLPAGFKAVTSGDYTASGFDRGHMCPSADRSYDKEALESTFLMTNMLPQAPDLNQKGWADLENHCRKLAREGKTLRIVAGPHGVGGVGSAGERDTLAGGKVTVPASCWKVIAIADGPDAASVFRLIAVVMPNKQGIDHDWKRFQVPARDVEKLTGYRFFDRVPATVIGPLKAAVR